MKGLNRMNKPTFRAWDKRHKEMLYDILVSYEGDVFKFAEVLYDTPNVEIEHIPEIILMQSTGLKGYMDETFNDSEEKEVAQGDVIDIFWEEWPVGYYQENHIIGVVDLDETGTAWVIKNGKYDWDNPTPIPSEIDGMSIARSLPDEEDLEEVFLHNFNLTSDDITILGNIHENPELLNEVSG